MGGVGASKNSDAVPQSQHWNRRRSSSTGGRGATVLPYFTMYRPSGRVHTALEGSVSGLGGRKWVKESAIEAEHASARKLFNSSLPWSLGSGDDTSAEHTPPGVNDAETSLFSCPRQEDETPCPSNSRGRCECDHHHQHFTGPSQLPISTCRFLPAFPQGGRSDEGEEAHPQAT